MEKNYQKYLPTSPHDARWGLHVLNVGYSHIKKEQPYPSKEHPLHHYFNWSKGRVLDEYQIIYISRGKGYFESASCESKTVNEGDIILLFPGEWHRFKPESKTGWDEFWVGCKGNIIRNLESRKFIHRDTPVLQVGMSERIVYLFSEIIEKTKTEKIGYQFYISGIVMHLLGLIQYEVKQLSFKPSDNTENIITKAQILLRNIISDNTKMENVAGELNVSYAWFRKAFKHYTGISPKQYLLQLRIEKAKIMLPDHSKPIKEIAFELNFETASYFSKQFKQKTGITPEAFRSDRVQAENVKEKKKRQ
ncbi:AraC family transcriptional regulator [Chitinophaga sp. MM2321]|uniref:AraC family transcriptional regulator n=1 Tax=Chitinophaga sp. MM2321 TaxID=3137178 RepID=UPI0032D5948F